MIADNNKVTIDWSELAALVSHCGAGRRGRLDSGRMLRSGPVLSFLPCGIQRLSGGVGGDWEAWRCG